MFNLVLFEPEIPPNTGNLIRLAANMGAQLHLIEPLGFSLDIKAVRRAGLDYHDLTRVRTYANAEACLSELTTADTQLFACTTKGEVTHVDAKYQEGDILLFGPETRGLPESLRNDSRVTARLRLPMCEGNRSLNLANAVSIVGYEAWRHIGFKGATNLD